MKDVWRGMRVRCGAQPHAAQRLHKTFVACGWPWVNQRSTDRQSLTFGQQPPSVGQTAGHPPTAVATHRSASAETQLPRLSEAVLSSVQTKGAKGSRKEGLLMGLGIGGAVLP